MERVEDLEVAINEYENNTKTTLTEKEKEIFRYGYGKGYLDNAATLIDILSGASKK